MQMLKKVIMVKKLVVLVVMPAALMLTAMAPALAQEGDETAFVPQGDEIAVTGVLTYQGAKADGTPVYGVKDESTQLGYVLEGEYLGGDYSPYSGERVTVYGIPGHAGEMRALYVNGLEEQPQ